MNIKITTLILFSPVFLGATENIKLIVKYDGNINNSSNGYKVIKKISSNMVIIKTPYTQENAKEIVTTQQVRF